MKHVRTQRVRGRNELHSLPAAALRLEPASKTTFGESFSSTARKLGHKARGLTSFGTGQSENLEALSQAQLTGLAHELGISIPEGATKSELIAALNNLD